jgi:hypothetical protein
MVTKFRLKPRVEREAGSSRTSKCGEKQAGFIRWMEHAWCYGYSKAAGSAVGAGRRGEERGGPFDGLKG